MLRNFKNFILLLSFCLLCFICYAAAKHNSDEGNKEGQKWPQNYPGGVNELNVSSQLPWAKPIDDDDGQNRNEKEQEDVAEREITDDDGEETEENVEDPAERAKSKWPQNYPGGGDGGFFPGHIGRWPGKNEWEDSNGHNRERHRDEDEHRGKGRDSMSWLDWFLPWYRFGQNHDRKHGGRERKPEEEARNNHHRNRHHGEREHSSEEEEAHNGKTKNSTETVVIRLSGGPIKGIVSYAAGMERPANVFKGIPFAEPPIGKLRFSPLRKKKPWKRQLLDATRYKAACLSNTTRTRSPQHYISEDCIYMNVFADPRCTKSKPCPVLFYVHGGGFAYDSATMFNDTQIVQKYASDGVVFMIPAYRLGVFGFFDLGADRPVKRNLGMHDIIFLLEWAKRELRAFGGDPKRITIMGNSAGASAVSYLCASPAVKEDTFQQAIISSGVPFFRPNANLNQTYALLEHFNCVHNNATNRTYSAREIVECMRRVDSFELLREQQRNEERGIVFSGPEMDKEIMPEKNYAEMMKHWKARPIIYLTTKHEFARWGDDRLPRECLKGLIPFGYTSPQAFNACMARYVDEFDTEHNMRVSYEAMHSESFLTGLVNTRLGGKSYIGEFELANYSNHADDLYFFFGLHYIPLNSSDVKLMDMYYPKMIKNFLKGHAPDKDWKPQNWNGRNYFRIAFNVSKNGTMLEWPHNVDGYQDIEGMNFWLRELPVVERNAREKMIKERLNKTINEKENVNDSGTWEQIFGGDNRQKRGHFLPGGQFIVVPNDREEVGQEAGLNGINNGTTKEAADSPMIGGANLMAAPEGAPPAFDDSNSPQMETDSNVGEGAEGPLVDMATTMATTPENDVTHWELGRVWSAYWLTTTIAVLLAVALFMMAVTKVVFRYKNVHGYHPTAGSTFECNGNGGGGGTMYNEKTRIVHANGNNGNAMRYT